MTNIAKNLRHNSRAIRGKMILHSSLSYLLKNVSNYRLLRQQRIQLILLHGKKKVPSSFIPSSGQMGSTTEDGQRNLFASLMPFTFHLLSRLWQTFQFPLQLVYKGSVGHWLITSKFCSCTNL